MSDNCCGGDRNDDDAASPRSVWIILGVVMLLGWGGLATVLLSRRAAPATATPR